MWAKGVLLLDGLEWHVLVVCIVMTQETLRSCHGKFGHLIPEPCYALGRARALVLLHPLLSFSPFLCLPFLVILPVAGCGHPGAIDHSCDSRHCSSGIIVNISLANVTAWPRVCTATARLCVVSAQGLGSQQFPVSAF